VTVTPMSSNVTCALGMGFSLSDYERKPMASPDAAGTTMR